MPRDISVAVFGTHATLSLEPVDMLGRSQKTLGKIRVPQDLR